MHKSCLRLRPTFRFYFWWQKRWLLQISWHSSLNGYIGEFKSTIEFNSKLSSLHNKTLEIKSFKQLLFSSLRMEIILFAYNGRMKGQHCKNSKGDIKKTKMLYCWWVLNQSERASNEWKFSMQRRKCLNCIA